MAPAAYSIRSSPTWSPWQFTTTAEVEECDLSAPFLSAGGQEIFDDGNAGGSSIYSEMFAFEMLFQCESAQLLKTETEILYDTSGPLTDMLVSFGGTKIGVSVTRAIKFPFDQPLSVAEATTRLEDKLADINTSSMNVNAADAWEKQILYVVTPLDASRGGVGDRLRGDLAGAQVGHDRHDRAHAG